MNALVDTGAYDIFISEEAASKLGIRVEKVGGWLKTINSCEISTAGVARNIDLWIGTWEGKETLEVIPLDDYEFIIGIDFLDRINALIVPHANCLCILDK